MQEPVKKKKIKVTRAVNGVEQEVEIEVDDVAGPEWGPNDKHAILNKHITRVDAPLKACGIAEYSYDKRLPGMLYGRILRSPHAHARVTRLDISAAEKIPGVRAIVIVPGEKVVEGAKKASEEADKKNPTEVGGKDIQPEREPGKVVRFEGEPVAAVAATGARGVMATVAGVAAEAAGTAGSGPLDA